MRRVADTVPEELCVYPALWSRQWNIFFGSGSTVLITDILSLQISWQKQCQHLGITIFMAKYQYLWTLFLWVPVGSLCHECITTCIGLYIWFLNCSSYLLVFYIQVEEKYGIICLMDWTSLKSNNNFGIKLTTYTLHMHP